MTPDRATPGPLEAECPVCAPTSRPPRRPDGEAFGLAVASAHACEDVGARSERQSHSSIRVAVRIRPLPPGESGIIDVLRGNAVAVRKAAATGGNEALSSQQGRTEERSFDRVFGPEATQAEVYAWSCKPLLVSSLAQGCSATVFVYGATGAGKTHTMFGEKREEDQGLIVRAIRDVFRLLEPSQADTSVKVSFLELYNERVHDLLQEASNNHCSLLEDERKGLVKISNLTELPVSSATQALQLLQRGLQLRKVESTAANQRSSRSHAVFVLELERGDRASRICLIDLAGSERASQTQNVGPALRDGAKINQSLLALANCINALGARGGLGRDKQKPPYRDSKLTLLLKSSLVGDGLVSMIANVHPGRDHFEDASITLEYAKRASSVKAPVLVRRHCRREAARCSSVPARPRPARGTSPLASSPEAQRIRQRSAGHASASDLRQAEATSARERSSQRAATPSGLRRGSSVPSARGVGIQPRRPGSGIAVALDFDERRPERRPEKSGASLSHAAAEVVTPQRWGLVTPQKPRSHSSQIYGENPDLASPSFCGQSPDLASHSSQICEVSAADIKSLLWGSGSMSGGAGAEAEGRKVQLRHDSPAGTTADRSAGAAGTVASMGSFLDDSPIVQGVSPMVEPSSTPSREDARHRDPDVLLQIVESLQAEKAALDRELRAVTSDRDRLRAANLEKDRQLALLLAPRRPLCQQCGVHIGEAKLHV